MLDHFPYVLGLVKRGDQQRVVGFHHHQITYTDDGDKFAGA